MTTVSVSTAIERYSKQTARSRQLHADAGGIIPGGVSRGTLAFQPYPFYAAGAAGAYVTDVDGNEYLDLVNNYTSLPHGHHHPQTVAAAQTELAQSSAVGTAHPLEPVYAKELRERIPTLQRLHFTTTGSEAVAFAARVARAVTARPRILKFEGGFHGSYSEFYRDIAVTPPREPGTSGPTVASSAGLEPTNTITAIYNDTASVSMAFEHWGAEIAAVVVEPFLGNASLVAAETDFLSRIFDEARKHGALVVFDEVQSLRMGFGGAQGRWGLTPDLTAIGKIMGGGFALAAFGGSADLLSVLEGSTPAVLQTGTFTAAPMAIAAGRAAMQALDEPAYERLEQLTETFRHGVREVFARHRLPIHVNGIGSMFNISISEEPVTSYRAHRAADSEMWERIRLEMVIRGVLIMPRGTGCLSTAVTAVDVGYALDALDQSIASVVD